MLHKLWLVPLTITVTAYVSALDDWDAEMIENIAQGAVGLHSKTFGVMLELDNTKVGEAVESVVPAPAEGRIVSMDTNQSPRMWYDMGVSRETLAETIDREEGEEVEDAVRRQSHVPYIV